MTVRELAEEHGVTQKTIRRDLSFLQEVGFPVSPKQGSHGRNHWIVTADASAPPLSFDVSEVLALYLGRTLLQPLAGTIVWESAQSAFHKIRTHLGEPALEYISRLGGLLHRTSFRDSRYEQQAQLVDDLMVAIEDQRITFITYQSARSTEPLTYDIYPYGLVYHRGSLYLIAHSQQHDEIRNFKVDRMSDVAMESLRFEKPADFNLQEYLKDSLGIFHEDGPVQHVVIRFAAEVAGYVQEHHWHHSQKLTPLPDGTLRAEFDLASLAEIKSWVLSFGAKAVVEEPDEFREEFEAEIASMARAHKVHNA